MPARSRFVKWQMAGFRGFCAPFDEAVRRSAKGRLLVNGQAAVWLQQLTETEKQP
ncbi:hypothetical protein NAP1_11038 [Erythrobacter sp. NAP1]|nr:hypothetical protein NAP1_11038 [Erythrobacter sp. NAP1]